MKITQIILIFSVFFLLAPLSLSAENQNTSAAFEQYLYQVAKDAEKLGVKEETIKKYLLSIKAPKSPEQSKQAKDLKSEPQDNLTFKKYIALFITSEKIQRARELYQKHLPLLRSIQRVYHVQPEYVIAIWGIESDFGKDMGDYPLMRSLALVSFADQKSQYMHQQLIDALVMLDRPTVTSEQLKSAFDGGMGQTQFEPSSYLRYGVDFDHNGFPNIWTSLPDVFASISYYLQQNGWIGQQTWGIQITLPKKFDKNLTGLKIEKFNREWNALGIRQTNGAALPELPGKTSILTLPWPDSPTFLVYPNFHVLLSWNNTDLESLAIGYLADAIVNGY